ncbi:DUF4476 domain-containing protein [Spirosoma sp.]|uniref:DUF4476 domain-containing protein n=1 Tax=Spirosoma sp. TaxID=1899569 RepID=UPI003B3AD8DA
MINNVGRAQSAFFLRIVDPGRYAVTINEQSLTLSSGRYRFFDLPAARSRLTISQNNITVYQDWVDLLIDNRVLAEFSVRRGLRIQGVAPLAFDSRFWDWSDPGVTQQGSANRSYDYANARTAMSAQAFDRIREAVDKQSLDSDKFDMLGTLLTDQSITSDQLAELLKLFTFDKKRLEAAKRCWANIVDKPNFYRVFDSFSFSSSVNDLKAFLATR